MPNFTEILSGLSILLAGLAAWTSLRKVNIEDRTGAVSDLQKVVDTYKSELARCQSDGEKERAAHIATIERLTRKHTEELQTLKADHTVQIEDLQRQINDQTRTITRQSGEITQLKAQMGTV